MFRFLAYICSLLRTPYAAAGFDASAIRGSWGLDAVVMAVIGHLPSGLIIIIVHKSDLLHGMEQYYVYINPHLLRMVHAEETELPVYGV